MQEEHVGGLNGGGYDPKWCGHAQTIIKLDNQLLDIINFDQNHCQVSQDKIQRLKDTTDRLKLLTQGC